MIFEDEIKTLHIFPDLSNTIAAPLLEKSIYPWEVLPHIKDFIRSVGDSLAQYGYKCIGDGVYIGKNVTLSPEAHISGPCIICDGAEVRHCAYIRGSAIIGRNAVIGNSSEIKNSIIFDCAQIPHFNYVGDSIIGYRAHLGASALTSNVKADKSNVKVKFEGREVETGLRKFGAVLGDRVEIGSGCILNPGTVISRDSVVYPLISVRGYIPENVILKKADLQVEKVAK